MRIKHSDLAIDKESPFMNCKLDREKYADVLTNIVSSYSDGFVLAINNKWGTGKTTFVKMWKQSLENKSFQTVYFNAWENDFENNPLTALIGELKLLLTDGESKTGKEKFQNVLRKGSLITKHVASAIIKALLSKHIDTDGLKETLVALSEGLSNVFEKEVEEYAVRKENIKEFQKSLSAFIAETVKKKPLIFIVDELDRCRPNYAVSILEQIKHLFSIPHIVFVLSIDKEQLGNAVRGVYGSDTIDADEYLRRFIDLEYSLPEPQGSVFYEYLYEYFKFDEFFESETRRDHPKLRGDSKSFLHTCSILFSNKNVALRLQEKMFSLARTALRSYSGDTSENTYVIPELFFFLVYIKQMDVDFYTSLKKKNLTLRQVQDRFYSVLEHCINSKNELSLVYLEVYLLNSYDIYVQDDIFNSKVVVDEEHDDNLTTIINKDLNHLFISELDRCRLIGFGEIGINNIIDRIDLLVNLQD